MCRGRGQSVQAGISAAQGLVYAITSQIEAADQSVIQGMFLLFRLWARVLFDRCIAFLYYCILCESIGLRG